MKRDKESGGLLVPVDPPGSLDEIGGLDYVKKHLRDILNAIKRGETNRVPVSQVLLGPPGTGKNALAEVLSPSLTRARKKDDLES